jgi:hypothetical protein
MGKSETFIAALAAIGQDFAASLEQAKLQVCLFPPKPWHIAEKQRAQAAFDAFQFTKRTPGMSFCYGEALALNHVDACIKDAIFAHRLMVAGNTAAQTFAHTL